MDKGSPPPTLHDLQMVGRPNPSMDKGSPLPQPFTNKWTRVPPPPNPSRLANGQGLNPSRLLPQPFTTCKWTRVGGPNPSRLANGQGLGPPGVAPITSTAFGQGLDPQPFAIWGGSPYKLYRFNIRFQADQAPCPKIDKSMTGPFGPERTPTQTSNLPPNHRTLEHISQGTGSVSTDRNINDKPFVPECTLEQVLNFA